MSSVDTDREFIKPYPANFTGGMADENEWDARQNDPCIAEMHDAAEGLRLMPILAGQLQEATNQLRDARQQLEGIRTQLEAADWTPAEFLEFCRATMPGVYIGVNHTFRCCHHDGRSEDEGYVASVFWSDVDLSAKPTNYSATTLRELAKAISSAADAKGRAA